MNVIFAIPMKVHYDISNLPSFQRAVLTIGTFDGVHHGHQQILEAVINSSKVVNGESVLITFHPHPRKIVSSAILGIRLITTMEERIQLLEKAGIDHLVIVPFTDAFANLSATQYIEDFLLASFHPHTIIIGHDHKFGRNRIGDYALLESYQQTGNFLLKEIPRHLIENITISSTRIREHLSKSEIASANKLLGYDFFFHGTVVHGNKIGRTLGFPTANLRIEDAEKIIPGNGIYAVYAKPEGVEQPLKGMMSIGFRPTVDGKNRVIEVNIFDFDKEIYGEQLEVHVHQYLREEKKYENLSALVEQISKDKIQSLSVL